MVFTWQNSNMIFFLSAIYNFLTCRRVKKNDIDIRGKTCQEQEWQYQKSKTSYHYKRCNVIFLKWCFEDAPASNVAMPSNQHSLLQALDFLLHKHPPTRINVMGKIKAATGT